MRVVFYSNKCQHCLKLVTLMKNMDMVQHFNFICVDNNNNIPNNIKKVPTLIVPDLNRPIEGKKAFEWVKNNKYFYRNTNNIYDAKHITNPNIKEDNFVSGTEINGNFTTVKDENKVNTNKVLNPSTQDIELQKMLDARKKQDAEIKQLDNFKKNNINKSIIKRTNYFISK